MRLDPHAPPATNQAPFHPAFAGPRQARAHFRAAALAAATFVVLLFLVHGLNWALDGEWQRLGIRPREWTGLIGLLLAPLLHADIGHLASNALPLLVLGTVTLHLYPASAKAVLPALFLGSGLCVWLLGRDSIHIGASGLVYGLAAFVFTSGVLRRDRRALAAALLVAFLYGTLIWGVLPLKASVSWETHLAAGLLGCALAFIHRRLDLPPQARYSWEDANEPEPDPGDTDQADTRFDEPPASTLPGLDHGRKPPA